MSDLSSLPLQLDAKKCVCRAIIETPKGARNKFDYDPATGFFKLGGLLPEGMMFPFDFVFLPSTRGEDGDPLDIMVLMDAPAHVGRLIEVRVIGIINAEQTQDGNTEINDVCLASRFIRTITRISKRSKMSARRCSSRWSSFLGTGVAKYRKAGKH